MAKEGARDAGREEEEGVSARGREGVGVGGDDRDREAAREAIKASVDLIRLASNAQARWSEDSIANAISWLQSAEAWAKHERARDLVISVIQELGAALPDGSPFQFDDLVTARDLFVRNLVLRTCGPRQCRETLLLLRNTGCSRARASADHYAGRLRSAESHLEVARALLCRSVGGAARPTAAQILGGVGASHKPALTLSPSEQRWRSFLGYLLSWRVVCLSAVARLRPNAEVWVGGKPDLEACCVLLLSHVWYSVVEAARAGRAHRPGGADEERGLAAMPREQRTALVARLVDAMGDGEAGMRDGPMLLRLHPGLLATLSANEAGFGRAYKHWLESGGEGRAREHREWLLAL